MNDVKAKLLELIAAVQAVDFDHRTDGTEQERLNLTVQNGRRSIKFGYGYFDGDKVLYRGGESHDEAPQVMEEMAPEAGVNRLLGIE